MAFSITDFLLGYPQPEKQGFRTDKTGRPLHWQHTRERAYNAQVIIKSLGQQEGCIRSCISAITEELTTFEVDASDAYARLRIESDVQRRVEAVEKWKGMMAQLAAYRKELRTLHEELLAVETEREELEKRYGIVIPV